MNAKCSFCLISDPGYRCHSVTFCPRTYPPHCRKAKRTRD